ncbi:MAG: N-acetylmuramoyl-L-alanine amidase [Bryobacteraceae bacterium]
MFFLPQRYRCHACTALILTGLPLWSAQAGGDDFPGKPRVTAVRFWSLEDSTRIVIEATGQFEFRSDRVDNPERVFFDLVGAQPQIGPKGIQVIHVGDRFIRQIRMAETQRGITRVVFDLASGVRFSTSQLANPDRLIIDFHPIDQVAHFRSPPPTPVFGKDVEPPRVTPPIVDSLDSSIVQRRGKGKAASPNPLAAVLPPTPVPQPPAPVFLMTKITAERARVETVDPGPSVTPLTARSVRTSLPEIGLPAKRTPQADNTMVRVLGLKVRRVVIDAGHGGQDAGTTGPDGLHEKDVALDVAKRLGALIQDRLGSEVIYTRTDDTFVPLGRRTAIANEANADLFLSIHVNSSPARAAAGVETYYLSFTTSRSAMETAARENAGADQNVHDLQDLLRQIALKDKVDESREFASRIQTSLGPAAARANRSSKDRGIKKAPFVVLIGATMPAVLVEIGFITNSQDEILMRRGDHRQRLAEALYRGLSSYANTLSHFQVAQQSNRVGGQN